MKSISFAAFHGGDEIHAYRFMGCHSINSPQFSGFSFRVWAPKAKSVFLTGDFCGWNPELFPMTSVGNGIFEIDSDVPKPGNSYKYVIITADGRTLWKADPYAIAQSRLPDNSSVVRDFLPFFWTDGNYRKSAARKNLFRSPMNIYEVHPGSWKRHPDGSFYSYREFADQIVPYAVQMGFTHIELLPVSEYPFEPSWGYQVTGYYAPSGRYGSPEDLKYFVDLCHRNGIGVIADWVPGHFPKDEYALYEYDGGCCYELSDPVMNEHPQWKTRLFDYSRPEVVSFLVSNAVYWVEEYHLDGLRVDAVATMLYLDFERSEWHPNEFGTNINYPAIRFLQKMNEAVSSVRGNVITAAEESTTFPKVTGNTAEGGLGFTFKWNMGWMNDVLRYFSEDPLFRKYLHNNLTFSMTYAFSEHFILPLSHDEVVHGKKSLLDKMPGSYQDKFANLRLLSALQISHPGKKLTFMGEEFGQFIEWNEQRELDWFLLDYPAHSKMMKWTEELNHFYLEHPQLWKNDDSWDGFEWLSCDDSDNSVIAFRRMCDREKDLVVIFNFCPVFRDDYRLGLPKRGCYVPVLCSDYPGYGGNGVPLHTVRTEPAPLGSFSYSAAFPLPPLSVSFYLQD